MRGKQGEASGLRMITSLFWDESLTRRHAADKRQRQRGAEMMGEVKERERKMLSDWLPVYVCELYTLQMFLKAAGSRL